MVIEEMEDEDMWRCDICFSRENDEDDPLTQCDLCHLVVHPACYRRDLYENDELPDDEPWFCARCRFVIEQEQSNSSNKAITLPNCFLCPDLKGAMVDLVTKEWVHHTCVNWHNEIWFEQDDIKLNMYGGSLNFERFELKCYICKVNQGACITCDFKMCKRAYHVRCAIKEKLILSNEEMEELRLSAWDIKVFCHQHTKCGKQKVQKLQLQKFLQHNGDDQMPQPNLVEQEEDTEMKSGDERVTRRGARS